MHLAEAGIGRPAGEDERAVSPWTPELLTKAITQVDSNRIGVELRTVQLWFAHNDKGISATNMRWLAMVCGCGDPEATSEWQLALRASQNRLTALRRETRRAGDSSVLPHTADENLIVSMQTDRIVPTGTVNDTVGPETSSRWRGGLARMSEAAITHGAPLNLPALIFAGISALGFLSYLGGIHNVSYASATGFIKQVGFLWAPNWILNFMVFMPLFFAFAGDLVAFWKDEGRSRLIEPSKGMGNQNDWDNIVDASSHTFWAVFVICVIFAGIIQWIGVRLIPLMRGGDDYAVDWGAWQLVHQKLISAPEAIVFTGLAYLYMSFSVYLFFAGLILIYTLAHDLWKILKTSGHHIDACYQQVITEIGIRVMFGIYRCTVMGLLIAICIKIQSIYLVSGGVNIVDWLISDMVSTFHDRNNPQLPTDYSMPNQYSSLLMVISTCFVFIYATIRLRVGMLPQISSLRMSAVVAVLVAGYMLMGAFTGFSILLIAGTLVAMYSLFDPSFGQWRDSQPGGKQNVS